MKIQFALLVSEKTCRCNVIKEFGPVDGQRKKGFANRLTFRRCEITPMNFLPQGMKNIE